MTMKPPRHQIVKVAERHLGSFAETGPKFPGFLDRIGYVPGTADCEARNCALLDYILMAAAAELVGSAIHIPPKLASVKQLLHWAGSADSEAVVFPADSQSLKPEAGDIVCYARGPAFDQGMPHFGIVTKNYADDGFLNTVEGNTNADGSRDRDGIWRKVRRVNFGGYFIRLDSK